uniref:Uncharacterized protein n=1 Tax=Panagrolaimus sp. JU765 TaxID=591449 RepID=A0AC34Q7J5_9BILA
MTDSVTESDVKDSLSSVKKLKKENVTLFGIGSDSSRGAKNTTNLESLIGDKNHVFADITSALDPLTGIIPEINKLFPCVIAKRMAVVFIGEMSQFVSNHEKHIFLNTTSLIAKRLSSAIGGVTYGLGLYTDKVILSPTLYDYPDFSVLVNETTQRMDTYNSKKTLMAPMLSAVLDLLKAAEMHHYVLLFMGETESVSDFENSLQEASKIASTKNFVYVIATNNTQTIIFEKLVNNRMKNMKKYSNETDQQLTDHYYKSFYYLIKKYS